MTSVTTTTRTVTEFVFTFTDADLERWIGDPWTLHEELLAAAQVPTATAPTDRPDVGGDGRRKRKTHAPKSARAARGRRPFPKTPCPHCEREIGANQIKRHLATHQASAPAAE